MKSKERSFSLKKIYTWIIIPVVSIILNTIIGNVQGQNGIASLILSLGVVSLLMIVLFYTHSKIINCLTNDFYYFKLHKGILDFSHEFKQRIDNRDDIDNPTEHFIGIIPEHELAKKERTLEFDEIWVISNDLSAEVGQYIDIVPHNLQRGIKYKFFYQKTPQNAIRIEQIKRNNNNSENAEYYCLHDDFFFIVANLDFTIYDPYSANRIGYMGIELPKANELYAVKVTNDLTDAIASKLLGYLNEA